MIIDQTVCNDFIGARNQNRECVSVNLLRGLKMGHPHQRLAPTLGLHRQKEKEPSTNFDSEETGPTMLNCLLNCIYVQGKVKNIKK
jgi:hypothetical protein